VDGLRRSPGFASEEASQQLAVGNWLKLPDSAGGLPGIRPSDRCGFLAYSCAAARELHPLPCLCHGAKTRKPKDISKNWKYWCEGIYRGATVEVNRQAGLAGRSVTEWHKSGKGQFVPV
jgi:hypothetical protein